MVSLQLLPTEILELIIFNFQGPPIQYANILSARRSCRALAQPCRELLYRDIDFNFQSEDWLAAQLMQVRLIRGLYLKKSNAAFIRTFKNKPHDVYSCSLDAIGRVTITSNWQNLVKTAKKMKRLTEAYMTPSFLAAQIIATAPKYKILRKLTVAQISPMLHIWDNRTTRLTTLRWELADSIGEDSNRSGFDDVDFLIGVVEATCPALINFDIVIRPPSQTHWPDISPLSLNRCTANTESIYRLRPASSLKCLRHFGQYYDLMPGTESSLMIDFTSIFHRFVEKHCSTLSSVVVAVGSNGGLISFNPALQACRLLPRLQTLSLAVKSRYGLSTLSFLENEDSSLTLFLRSLSVSNRFLQRLSISNVGGSFHAELGALFGYFEGLKSLRVGNTDMAIVLADPFGHPSPQDCQAYKSGIVDFIHALPESLEEVYLGINITQSSFAFDYFFVPLNDIGPEVFTYAPRLRLHTLDLHLWLHNESVRLDPGAGVFCRRLPHPVAQKDNARRLWTSVMHLRSSNFTSGFYLISHRFSDLELKSQKFLGHDARGIWLDGSDEAYENWGRWPGYRDKISSYPPFQNRY